MLALISIVTVLTLHGAEPGNWPEPRGNAQLTALQALPGHMAAEPMQVAQLDLGKTPPSPTAVNLPDGSPLGIVVLGGAVHAFRTDGREAWYSHPDGLNFSALQSAEDLDGDGQPELLLSAGRPTEPYSAAVLLDAATGTVRWRYDVEPMSYSWTLHTGSFVTGAPGKQIVVLMQGYPPDPKNGYIALFQFNAPGAAPHQAWRYDFDKYTCFPSLLQTDIDGDGTRELVVETHSRMWCLDVRSGAVKHFVEWDVSPANIRSYGLTKFVDLDKDGREDFLCIANFAQHHEVLLNRGGKLEEAWHHGWGESVTTGKVATRYPATPDVDVDGDGRTDLVLSMFNSEDDNAWLLRVYDAVSGELKYRAPGEIAVYCGDLDGDGRAEILANDSTDPTGAVIGGARLLQWKEGALRPVWSAPNTRAVEGDAPMVDAGGERKRLAFDAAAGWSLAAPPPPPPAPPSRFSGLPAIVGPAVPTLLAAPLDEAPGCTLIAYSEPQVSVYRLEGASLAKKGAFRSACVPALGDLDGDGKAELVLTHLDGERPSIEAVTPATGKVLWNTTLPLPTRTGLPQPRKAYVRTIHLQGKATPDLYVWLGAPVVRSLGMDGATGAVLWEKGETAGLERYWGPSVNFASTWDFNGDGKEDLIFTNPDYYCIANGPTGEALLGPLFPPKIFSQPSQGLYTYPAILQRPDGAPEVCLVDGHYFVAGMMMDAQPLWYKLPVPGENRCAAEAFANTRAGAWRLGFGRQNGKFACLDATNGAVLYESDLAATASDAVAWDSDGDGETEWVFGDSHGRLHRIPVELATERPVDKTAQLGRAPLGMPMPADLDGDGTCELIVPTADGNLIVLR